MMTNSGSAEPKTIVATIGGEVGRGGGGKEGGREGGGRWEGGTDKMLFMATLAARFALQIAGTRA